jgi:hypothetical protein
MGLLMGWIMKVEPADAGAQYRLVQPYGNRVEAYLQSYLDRGDVQQVFA